ncbi:MAG: hypothetical protein RMJ67_09355, partial [Elusimicrobiota bacterium]|nr:hypothetical protein [Endomicrobiia bacterium]MDW8166703.1 hypothetical protein [Elusimicrobiota bacterium]
MKGQIIGLIIVIVSVFLFMGGLWGNLISQSSASASISAKEVQILRTIEQIEGVKIGIPYMMNYSLLQSFYEYGKRGGWNETDYKNAVGRDLSQEEYPIWRNYSNRIFLPYFDKVINYTRNKTQDYINEYLKVLDEKYKFIMKIKNISLNRTPPTLQLQTNISFNGEFFKIKENISYTLPINPMFFEMYEKSKEIFLDGDRVFEKIDEANRTMP